ncbi:MAG: papain-like cysteine protease family protein, partial [Oscillospiraceae bacterium]|nr:papain-like cysteine protease family protein [Oscillospiraceae bacterium]
VLLCACAAEKNFTDEMKIPYAADLSAEDGADSVERQGDHEDSAYYAAPDVYNMESTDTRTVLTHFKTQQQTSEWSCGASAALMVLQWYDALGDWDESSLAALRHPLSEEVYGDYPGTTLRQMTDMFSGVGGFDLVTTETKPDGVTLEDMTGWLADGKPILVCWIDWGGHWQVIIGYDTMGTASTADDVLLMADPYDATDHNQDGYGVYSAERMLSMFSLYGAFTADEGGSDLLFAVASPSD